MTQDEALKLVQDALEALENISTALREDDVLGSDIEMLLNAAAAIRVALARPAQEPVQDENAIRADEREACAKMCEKVAVDYYTRIGGEHEPYMRATAEDCARHIRGNI